MEIMEDYACLPYQRKRVATFDIRGTEESYLTNLLPELKEELANYIPYDEIPYSLGEGYWRRRGMLFGANTPSKEEYAKVYSTSGGCTYGKELRGNIRSCFLDAARTHALEQTSDIDRTLAGLRVTELAGKATLMGIPLVDEDTDIRSWKPFTVLAIIASVGAIDLIAKLPHDDYVTLVSDMLHIVRKDTALSAHIRDGLFFTRVTQIVRDKTQLLVMRSEHGYPQAVLDTFQSLITVIQPSSRLLQGFVPILETLRLDLARIG